MEIWQNGLSRWTRWWNTQVKVHRQPRSTSRWDTLYFSLTIEVTHLIWAHPEIWHWRRPQWWRPRRATPLPSTSPTGGAGPSSPTSLWEIITPLPEVLRVKCSPRGAFLAAHYADQAQRTRLRRDWDWDWPIERKTPIICVTAPSLRRICELGRWVVEFFNSEKSE